MLFRSWQRPIPSSSRLQCPAQPSSGLPVVDCSITLLTDREPEPPLAAVLSHPATPPAADATTANMPAILANLPFLKLSKKLPPHEGFSLLAIMLTPFVRCRTIMMFSRPPQSSYPRLYTICKKVKILTIRYSLCQNKLANIIKIKRRFW